MLNDVYFSPLSMTTLVELINLVIERKPIGVFNVGSHNGMTKAAFDFTFAEHLKLPTAFMTHIDTSQATFLKAYRPKDMRMDCSKFEATLQVLKLPTCWMSSGGLRENTMKSPNQTLEINSRKIGRDHPVYFIADIAANHDSDLARAKELIRLAAEAGADAAKFQHFTAATIVSDRGFKDLGATRSHQAGWKKSVFEIYDDASVSAD